MKKSVQEKESVPDDVPEQVATSADANFFSLELIQVWKRIHADVPLVVVLRTRGSNNVFTFAYTCAWFEGENIWWFLLDTCFFFWQILWHQGGENCNDLVD